MIFSPETPSTKGQQVTIWREKTGPRCFKKRLKKNQYSRQVISLNRRYAQKNYPNLTYQQATKTTHDQIIIINMELWKLSYQYKMRRVVRYEFDSLTGFLDFPTNWLWNQSLNWSQSNEFLFFIHSQYIGYQQPVT